MVEGEELIRQGGDPSRQHSLGRLTARERLELLLDEGSDFLELGLWAGHDLYPEYGPTPAAGVLCGVGEVKARSCMIIANDATVKAGAFFPQTVKKVLRAQRIAYNCRLPLLYLVDSSGVFLPLQDEIFPDEDDFGRIFRNNAVLSACGIPQIAAIMGNCIAGGAYLPVLCDQLIMTEGSGLYLAGPSLVKAAIGQEVETEELGGAHMHAALSGTVDFVEKDDPSCIARLRSLVALLPEDAAKTPLNGAFNPQEITSVFDPGSMIEYKAEYGATLLTAYGRIDGEPVGLVANRQESAESEREGTQIGRVLYDESADKGARFVMECNQAKLPLLFFQDVTGFMVGREAEQSGIIRSGAKMVNAISNSVVPKITVITGSSFGAGNYALCGKAYDPTFIFAWPEAKFAVMGADQAAATLGDPGLGRLYERQMDIRYGAARGWVDAIIEPESTRAVIAQALRLARRRPTADTVSFHTGVLQV